jgi:hypothetical protein
MAHRKTPRPEKWDSIQETGKHLGYSYNAMMLWVHRGQIPANAKMKIFAETLGAIGLNDMEFPKQGE